MAGKLFGLVVAMPLAVMSGAQAADIRLLSSWDKTNPAVGTLADPFIKGVETATKGGIKFIVNGPETVPPFEQLQPASSGAFQMLFTHGIYHYGTSGLAVGMDAVRGDPEARRKSGMIEALDKHYQKLGLKVVAVAISATKGYHYRAACAGWSDRRSAGPQDSRHAELSLGDQHAGRRPGRAAGRRGVLRAGEGRRGRRGVAGLRRSRHALV